MRLLFIILLFSTAQAQVTNRFYFPASTAAAVSPAFDANWTFTSEAARFKLADTKGSSAITTGTQIGPWTSGQIPLDRQYVSTRMDAGVVFTAASSAFQSQIMTREYATNDDITTWVMIIRVVSEDAATVRATLYANTNATGTEYINNATHRNQGYPATLMTGSYTTVSGDRLVIEMGFADDGAATTPEASAKWGENATDLPIDNTQTTDGAGWIDIQTSAGITFIGEAAGSRKIYRNN
jgi:hypothetical protein